MGSLNYEYFEKECNFIISAKYTSSCFNNNMHNLSLLMLQEDSSGIVNNLNYTIDFITNHFKNITNLCQHFVQTIRNS